VRSRRAAAVPALLAVVAALVFLNPAHSVSPQATPRAKCGPGSRPETGIQGRVPPGSTKGFTCNVELLGHEGKGGGFKVERFVDKHGHECAYYDTTLLFPLNAQNLGDHPTGVAVLDMSNPRKPKRTATLVTPAMQTPHESLLVNERRGLLAAVSGNPITEPGVVDVYDLNDDCRKPALQASAPVGFLGHESGFAPDGKTFYATSLFDGHVTAVDLTNPKLPHPVGVFNSPSHGMTVSDDGKRGYVAGLNRGLIIVDLSEIQARKPNPQVREISHLSWDDMTIPQVAIPVTIDGKKFVVEIDEFSTDKEGGAFPVSNGPRVGAARIISIEDEKHPKLVSDIRLAVHQPENRPKLSGDPGAASSLQGYAGHYCNVPQRKDPGIVACSFIASGLRVFDIRDPYHPKELAYFVTPLTGSQSFGDPSNYAMSAPAFVPERREIWYADGNTGFYAVRVAKGVWPFQACGDRRAPVTALRRSGVRAGTTVKLRGSSRDPGPCASGVRKVQVSLARVKGRTGVNCRFVKRSNRYSLTRPKNCRRPVLFTAKGTRKWSFTFRTGLKPGRYRAQARATDRARNKERPKKRRNIVLFRVR
jgi:hypothetical protein